MREAISLTEWLDQCSYLLAIAPHTPSPVIAAKLVKDDGNLFDPSWHTEIEKITWLELNDSIKAVRDGRPEEQGEGEAPGKTVKTQTWSITDRASYVLPSKQEGAGTDCRRSREKKEERSAKLMV